MHIDIAASGIKHTTRTETLNKYFNDIAKKNKLTNSEIDILCRKYKDETNPKLKDYYKAQIINSNLLFVISIAKRYSTSETLMDVVQEGNIGLIRALENYNPEASAKFITFAVNYIVREINDYKSRKEQIVRKSNSGKVYHIKKRVKEILFKEYNREPSLEEIKDYINEHYELYKIKDVRDLIDVHLTYVDDTSTNDSDSQINMGEMLEYNTVSASSNTFLSLENKEHTSFLANSLLQCLKPNERAVIQYLYGINEYREHTITETAVKLNYTSERIRQLRDSAMEKMKKMHTLQHTVR